MSSTDEIETSIGEEVNYVIKAEPQGQNHLDTSMSSTDENDHVNNGQPVAYKITYKDENGCDCEATVGEEHQQEEQIIIEGAEVDGFEGQYIYQNGEGGNLYIISTGTTTGEDGLPQQGQFIATSAELFEAANAVGGAQIVNISDLSQLQIATTASDIIDGQQHIIINGTPMLLQNTEMQDESSSNQMMEQEVVLDGGEQTNAETVGQDNKHVLSVNSSDSNTEQLMRFHGMGMEDVTTTGGVTQLYYQNGINGQHSITKHSILNTPTAPTVGKKEKSKATASSIDETIADVIRQSAYLAQQRKLLQPKTESPPSTGPPSTAPFVKYNNFTRTFPNSNISKPFDIKQAPEIKLPPLMPTPTSVTPTSVNATPTSVMLTPTSSNTTPTSVMLTPTSVLPSPVSVKQTPTSYMSSPTSILSTPVSVMPTPTSVVLSPTSVAQATQPLSHTVIMVQDKQRFKSKWARDPNSLPFTYAGQSFNIQAQKLILNVMHFFKTHKRDEFIDSIKTPQEKAARVLNVSSSVIGKIRKNFKAGRLEQPGKKRQMTKRVLDKVNTFDEEIIRKIIRDMAQRKQTPTIPMILAEARVKIGYTGSRTSFRRILHRMGYKYGKIEKKMVMLQSGSNTNTDKSQPSIDPNLIYPVTKPSKKPNTIISSNHPSSPVKKFSPCNPNAPLPKLIATGSAGSPILRPPPQIQFIKREIDTQPSTLVNNSPNFVFSTNSSNSTGNSAMVQQPRQIIIQSSSASPLQQQFYTIHPNTLPNNLNSNQQQIIHIIQRTSQPS